MKLKRVVSVSGGKDSTAVALIALEQARDECAFVFADTGNEHELTLEYVYEYLPKALGISIDTVRADFTDRIAGKRKYIEEKWAAKGVSPEIVAAALAVLYPTGNPFLDLCIWKGRFPSRMVQFCTQELKRRVLDDYMLKLLEQGFAVESWRGIRRDESQNRKNALAREQTAEGWDAVHPIVDWTAQQTVDYVVSRGVKLNPLYSLGMGRVGCMPCINCGKDELLAIATRFPEHIDRIRKWESIVSAASKQGASTFFGDRYREDGEETALEAFERLRVDRRVAWAKTSRGGKQLDALRAGMAPEACSSVYGLCE